MYTSPNCGPTVGEHFRAVAIATFVESKPRDAFELIVKAALLGTMAAGKIAADTPDPQLADDADDACMYAGYALQLLDRVRPYNFILPIENFVLPPTVVFNRSEAAFVDAAQQYIDQAIELLGKHHQWHPELKLEDLVGVSYKTDNNPMGRIVILSAFQELWYGLFETTSDLLH